MPKVPLEIFDSPRKVGALAQTSKKTSLVFSRASS